MRYLFQIFGPCFNPGCPFSCCLKWLFGVCWIAVLCQIYFMSCAIFFSPSLLVCFLSFPLHCLSVEKKILISMKFSVSVLSFTDWTFGVVSEKSLMYLRSSRCPPRYLHYEFCSSVLFESLIQFELIFVVGKLYDWINILHVDVQLFQHHLLKGLLIAP